MLFSSVGRFIFSICLNYIAQSTVCGNGTPNTIVPHVYVVLIVGQMVWALSKIFLVNEVFIAIPLPHVLTPHFLIPHLSHRNTVQPR